VPGKATGYTHFTVMATGDTLLGKVPLKAGPRTFWVRVPADYDPSHPYRVVYIGQGCGGYGVANTSTMQLYNEPVGGTEEAIYVALDIPTDMANQDCYDNRDGPRSQEWEAFQLFHTFVDANYCVDNDRVYVAGYSTGGTLANQWGCYFAGDGAKPASGPTQPRAFAPQYHVRAQGATASFEPDNNPPCNGPVAGFWIHDLMDSVPYSGAVAARDRVLRMNGCTGSPTEPWHPEIEGMGVCVKHTSCPAAYPVVFCTTTGQGHYDQHDRAIPGLALFFKELEQAAFPAKPPP
jgi:poly(3-hydroxybutyrate) depolymerase